MASIGLSFSLERGYSGPTPLMCAIRIFVFLGTSMPAITAISYAERPTTAGFIEHFTLLIATFSTFVISSPVKK